MAPRRTAPASAPVGLVASCFDLGEHAFVLLEWPVATRSPPAGLTRAEEAVLELLLAGLSNAQIATRRRRSPRTVANQVAALFRRLGVSSRLQLFALLAERRGDGARR